ncbi:ribonuclease HII [bacterium]|nr:ribonuclease HII [bacterium]|tara:strand:+ start:21380 stop:21991 length:612 start_codon:yes stop_codon:yes gene_type:complete
MSKKIASINHFFVGVDEAGRGPLAGPVAVGVVVAPLRSPKLSFFREVKDSKKLSGQKRREIFEELHKLHVQKELSYAVAFSGPDFIDREGINPAIYKATKRCLNRLGVHPERSHILLDGGLKAPAFYTQQETIIRGDEQEVLIALASIVAKVSRDKKMEGFALRYPHYMFEEHKGYGTELHRKLIKKHKPCPIHRKSFLGNIV